MTRANALRAVQTAYENAGFALTGRPEDASAPALVSIAHSLAVIAAAHVPSDLEVAARQVERNLSGRGPTGTSDDEDPWTNAEILRHGLDLPCGAHPAWSCPWHEIEQDAIKQSGRQA